MGQQQGLAQILCVNLQDLKKYYRRLEEPEIFWKMYECCHWEQAFGIPHAVLYKDLCELFAAFVGWKRGIWGERDWLMTSFIMCSGTSQVTVTYVAENRLCTFLANLPHFQLEQSRVPEGISIPVLQMRKMRFKDSTCPRSLNQKMMNPDLDSSMSPAWLSRWWMDSVHEKCLECAIWMTIELNELNEQNLGLPLINV